MDREESGSDALTSLQVRRARQGESRSIAWVVERFTPLLRAQARYRLGPSLSRHVDPTDLVHDVWAVALAALPELEGNASRATPTLVAFLSKTLLLRVNELTRRRIRDESRRAEEGTDPLSTLPDETRGIVTRVVAGERPGIAAELIAEHPDRRPLVGHDAATTIHDASRPRTDHPTVRIQFVRTSRAPSSASHADASRPWLGTCRATVERCTTPRTASATAGSHRVTPGGGSATSHSAVTPSTAIGGPTTNEIRRVWACS